MTSASCSIKPAISIQPKAVRVNGVPIPRDLIARETQNHPAEKPIDAWKAAARALVVRELLLQEATKQQIVAEPQRDADGRSETPDEAAMRALVERDVRTPEPGDDECRRYFDQNTRRFRTPDLYEVSHILLSGGKEAAEREAARELCMGIIADLNTNPEAFADYASQYSLCPSKEVGGSLGQIGPGQTVSEFETALAKMTPGRIHPGPVESRYGLHIVRVERHIVGRELPFEIAKPMIADYLTERVQRMAMRQYIAVLAGRAHIEGIAIEAAASPLVQ